MFRSLQTLSVYLGLLLALLATLALPKTVNAQGGRLPEVGGYGLVLYDTPTFEYGSLDSRVNGTARKGEIVYLNGWQIGVYHVGDFRWIAAAAIQPIIDAYGRPMVDWVARQEGGYTMNGRPIQLPPKHIPHAERFLREPPAGVQLVYTQTTVPTDMAAELVDTDTIWLAPGEPVVATMRVTDAYDFIYLRTAPSENAPIAEIRAFANEILTAYEVRDNRWYRIGPDLWAPGTWGGETLLFPENVEAYAPPEYYNGGKWISIDLNRQQLTAWEGKDVVLASRVKSGKYGYHTPVGVWRTFSKIPNERMSGSDYDLMDVAWTQYFTSSGIAIHGAYWHNNYNGRPGSHGCVNVPMDVARELFMWAPLGTTVVTHNPYIFDEIDIQNANRWAHFNRW